jgi:hypothetical protein
MSVLGFFVSGDIASSITEQQQLSAELAALFSLAMDRRVDIPLEVAVQVQGSPRTEFIPYSGALDRTIIGPIQPDSQANIAKLLACVSGLTSDDQGTLGAAASLLHGSMLLFDRDIRSAYTLLVAGIEVLSREYGAAPTDWHAWDDHQDWDKTFGALNLSDAQREGVRLRLFKDKHLRLKATFREYASTSVPDEFWDQVFDEWAYPLNMATGELMEGFVEQSLRIREVLPFDRAHLRGALGHSYDLRSKSVHRGQWIGPLDLVLAHGATVQAKQPLPYSLLRQLLAALLRAEITRRATPTTLPQFSVFRGVPEPSKA